jgi:hypothetical protein
MNALQGALYMAARGFPVFRVKPGGKDPFAAGVKEATRDPAKIRHWFSEVPDLNYGVALPDHVGLDVDAKEPGSVGLENLFIIEAACKLPRTLRIATPSGGQHLIFGGFECGLADLRHPEFEIRRSKNGRRLTDINVRSTRNGYLVGPGSVVGGRPYRIVDDAPVAPCPDSLKPYLGTKPERDPDADTPVFEIDKPSSIASAIGFLKNHPPAIEGQGGDVHTYKTAARVRDMAISEALCLELMLEHWNGRCEPPWGFEELEKKVANAYSYAQKPAGNEAPELEFEKIPGAEQPGAPLAPQTEAHSLFSDLDVSADPASLPPIPWLFQGLVVRGTLTGLAAPGGVGKSALTIALGVAVALGNGDMLRMPLKDGPQSVLWINNEDDYDMLQRRVYAFCLANKVDRSQLAGRLKVYRHSTRFLAMVRENGGLRKTKAVNALRAYILAHDVGLCIFDPFVEISDAEHNNTAEEARVLAILKEAVAGTGCAGIVVHHSRKPQGASSEGFAGDPDSARGGAFRNSVRSMWTLYPPSAADADKYGMSEPERRSRLRLDVAKGNYSKASNAARWFEFVSVPLGNPDDPDEVGALRPIDLTDQEARRRALYHACIAQALLDSDDGLKPQHAAKLVLKDPMLGKIGSPAKIAKRLVEFFSDPFTLNGICVHYEEEQNLLRAYTAVDKNPNNC